MGSNPIRATNGLVVQWKCSGVLSRDMWVRVLPRLPLILKEFVMEMSAPSRFPGMKVGEPSFPRMLDGPNSSRGSYRPRTGNSNGIQRKTNKGGKRSTCTHLGMCGGCRN